MKTLIKNMNTQTLKLTFDGCGINHTDEYASRIANLTQYGNKLQDDGNVGDLLSAAPELLEALKGMVATWNGPREQAAVKFAHWVNVANLAISKAEGRDS